MKNLLTLQSSFLIFFSLVFSNLHGQSQPTADLDQDGLVGVTDLMVFLSVFGEFDLDFDGVYDSVDECVGAYDECGVCNGPRSIYDCGCTPIPEGDCDCNGSQLDSLGICGGNCFSDIDNNGICDNLACDFDSILYNGYWYETVSIAGQCWFAENLRTLLYTNGDTVDFYENYNNWTLAYQNQNGMVGPPYPEIGYDWECNTLIGGLQYNWWAVGDERGLCPSGWHIPSISEFNVLSELFSSSGLRTTNDHWLDEPDCSGSASQNWDGTNISGFSAVKAYSIWQWGYTMETVGQSLFWTSDQAYQSFNNSWVAYRFKVDDQTLSPDETGNGFSVRCIKD